MKDKDFCLLDEGWIKVLDENMHMREVSLCELFANAHKYKCLAGESATQDVAIFRVLLAIAITVFYRTDADGNNACVLDNDNPKKEILNRWREYYKRGKFYDVPFVEYLEKYRERFYLFHPNYPFWQVSELKYGTEYDIKCLMGNMKESNNKDTMHHFSVIDGKYLKELDYAEVARWLIYLNAYAVNIKVTKNVPGTENAIGTGRLGRLGFIMVNGETIFEMLMFNLCALRDGKEAWNVPKPIWERSNVEIRQRIEIKPPDNLPELYTIQSRRILLNQSDGKITGFNAIGGDYYDILNDTTEQMTLLCRRKPKKKGDEGDISPKKHSKEINAWREFPSLFVEGDIKPGLVQWMEKLQNQKLIDRKKVLTFKMTGLEYKDNNNSAYGDIIDDALSMSADFLSELGKPWIVRVKDQVEKCEKVEQLFSFFAKDLAEIIYNGDTKKNNSIKKVLASRYYFLLNNPFREWLVGINPKTDDKDKKQYEWERQSYLYAKRTVDEYIHKLDCAKFIHVMKSYNHFMAKLNSLYRKEKTT